MRRDNRIRWIGGAVALMIAAGLGFGAATSLRAPIPEGTEEEVGHDEAAKEDFVALTAAQRQAAGIIVTTLRTGGGSEVLLTGRVEPQPGSSAAIGATVSGRVEQLLIAPGMSVRAGQAVAILVSGEAASLHAEAVAAEAAASAASASFARETRLLEEGVVARQDWEAARAASQSAAAQAQAARARAVAVGSPSASGRTTITSPIAGVVTRVSIAPGAVLAAGGLIAEVTDPDQVELVFSAPAEVASRVSAGSQITIETVGGDATEAVVTAVAPSTSIAGGGATIRARASSIAPPVGSSVTARVVTGDTQGFTVPSEAIQTVEGRQVVFVEADNGFRAVTVMIGRQAGGRTEIVRGLSGSERIASTNAFLLKAELGRGDAEHGH